MKQSLSTILLLAARELVQPFSTQQLVVQAWKLSPRRLGLAGYEEGYPDSNRVIACLCGRNGPLVTGLLERVAPNMYQVTAAGRAVDVESDYRPPDPAREVPENGAAKAGDLIKDCLLGPTHEELACYRRNPQGALRLYTERLKRLGKYLSLAEAERVLEES